MSKNTNAKLDCPSIIFFLGSRISTLGCQLKSCLRTPDGRAPHLDEQQPDEHELELQAAEHGGLGDDQGEHGQTQPVRGNSHQAKHSKDIQLLIRLRVFDCQKEYGIGMEQKKPC